MKPKNTKPECGKCAYLEFDPNMGWYCSYALHTGKLRGEISELGKRSSRESCSKKYDILVRASYEEFQTWPKSVQKGYLEHLYSVYGVGNKEIGNMFGISKTTVSKWNKLLGIYRPIVKHGIRAEEWELFLLKTHHSFPTQYTSSWVWA